MKETGELFWPELVRGILVKRYKRFMADVTLENGIIVTAHCTNSGRMTECSAPGRVVFLSRQDRPGRRLKYTWEMIEMPDSLVGVNTIVPNKLVRSSIMAGSIPGLCGYDTIRSEVTYGERSRVDLLLKNKNSACFVEIKNCTLVRNKIAYFPDAPTSRGLKHLRELQKQVSEGNRAVIFFVIQRMDADLFMPAYHIDPDYGRELEASFQKGVEIMVYDVIICARSIRINRQIPFELG